MKLSGADILWTCLLREGVDYVFGYPGGAVLPIYDAMAKFPEIHHVLARHEQGAAHMADGYARATGKVGVALATSGPGATNLVTGIATAMLDSSPVVFLTGQIPSMFIGTNGFQEADITGITLPITKHNFLVTDVHDLARCLREAFHYARSGRPGPVLVDIPKDVQTGEINFVYPEEELEVPRAWRRTAASDQKIETARQMLGQSQRPVILAGHGIEQSGSSQQLREFAERSSIPVALTLLGKGALPEQHELCLGMMGMHGTAQANHAIQQADLLIALGMRFDDRVTGNPATYATEARKIHVDIDASSINSNVQVDLGIVGDLNCVLDQMLDGLKAMVHGPWLEQIHGWKKETSSRDLLNRRPAAVLTAPEVVRDLWRYTDGEAITVTDVGQHQMWEAQYYLHSRPMTHITSGGMGTMGFGLPAAIGAKLARPDDELWLIVGDGGFQMTLAELATACQENVEIKIALINNGYLGMVRQWQELFYERRYHATPMQSPDFCRLASSYGIPALRVENREEIEQAIATAQAHKGGPFLIEFAVEALDAVYPMVPPGADLQEMIRRPHPSQHRQGA